MTGGRPDPKLFCSECIKFAATLCRVIVIAEEGCRDLKKCRGQRHLQEPRPAQMQEGQLPNVLKMTEEKLSQRSISRRLMMSKSCGWLGSGG